MRERLRASGLAALTVPRRTAGGSSGRLARGHRRPRGAGRTRARTWTRCSRCRASAATRSRVGGARRGPQGAGCPRSARWRRSPRSALTEPQRRLGPAGDHHHGRARTATSWSSTGTSRSSPTPATPTSTACWPGRATGFSLVLVPADTPGVTRRPSRTRSSRPHVLGRRGLRRRAGAGRPPARRARQGLRAGARDAGDVPGVGGRRGGRARPRRALDEAIRHAAGREQFGVPLARLGRGAGGCSPRPGSTSRWPGR